MGDDRSMAELVRRWDELLMLDDDPPRGRRRTRAVQESGSVLRSPATEEQVEAAERRLGRDLPASYREFLLVSDGAYADHWGVTTWDTRSGREGLWSESSVVGAAFLPLVDVAWLRERDPWFAEACEDTAADADPGGDDGRAVRDGQEVWPWTPFAGGLLIATDKGPGTTCLVPFDDEPEWQVWEIEKEISHAYLSFRSLLELVVASLEPVETLAAAEHVVQRMRLGETWARKRLARVRTPDAVPLLASLLQEGRCSFEASQGLGWIGTDEAVDALRLADPWYAEQGLVRAGTLHARDVLAERGLFDGLDQLADPRAVETARRFLDEPEQSGGHRSHAAAASVLGRSGDPTHVPALRRLLASRADEYARAAAACALARLGENDARQLLEEIAARDHHSASYATVLLHSLEP